MRDWTKAKDVTRVILVRHGQPAEALRGRCYGRLEVPRSDEGRAQVERVARYLVGSPLAAVYSSPRVRALDSARQIAAVRGWKEEEVQVEDALRELDFGELEGLTFEEAE